MIYWFVYFFLLLFGIGGALLLLIRFHRAKAAPLVLANLILTFLAVFITFMALELYFKVFFAQPDALPTLARQNWREQFYEGTINSLGYRDVEWNDKLVAGKIKVAVLGDSFVEGYGIENPEDRFSNQLAQKLGLNYVVFNLGKAGASTEDEIEAITRYPYPPDILVLSYFVNDIEGSAATLGLRRPSPPEIPPHLGVLVENSYVSNFLYWRIFRLVQASRPDDLKWGWFLGLYDYPDVWSEHQQQLLSIYEKTQRAQIPLLVVVFPIMDHVQVSQAATERVINLYREKGVPVLNVTHLIADIPRQELIASPVDSHPSELVHSLVAQKLYEIFVDTGLTKRENADANPQNEAVSN